MLGFLLGKAQVVYFNAQNTLLGIKQARTPCFALALIEFQILSLSKWSDKVLMENHGNSDWFAEIFCKSNWSETNEICLDSDLHWKSKQPGIALITMKILVWDFDQENVASHGNMSKSCLDTHQAVHDYRNRTFWSQVQIHNSCSSPET